MTFSEFLRRRGQNHAHAPDNEADPVGRWCWLALARAKPEVIDQAAYEYFSQLTAPVPNAPRSKPEEE